MLIDWIDFGQVSAERDEHLSEYFHDNGALNSVISNKHQFLVLGRKGAGKTAVFQHLRDNSSKYLGVNDSLISLSLQDYSWDIHKLLSADGRARSMSYIQSWKYVIYLLAIKEIISKRTPSGKLKIAARLIEKVYSSPAPSLSQVIGQKLLQLSRLKLPSGGLDIDGFALDSASFEGGEIAFHEASNDKSIQSRINQSIERITDIFDAALLENIDLSSRLFISFDRIDEAWDASSFEESRRIIAGLIGATEFISARFNGYLRPIVFLQEDIFETLDMNDKNKLRSDCGQLLSWKKESLSRMLLERINFFARNAHMPGISNIDDLFDKDQMRQQRAPFDHILLRTMSRPRDVIKMLLLTKGDMLDRRDNPFDKEDVNPDRIECQAIYNVEPAYSEWIIEELRDEWRAQYPTVNVLLEAIKHFWRTNFSKSDLIDSIKKIDADASKGDTSVYLKFLFDNSIIGFRIGKSNQWRFKCFFPTQGFVDSDLYKVHDGLHRGLNLTESRSAS